MEYSVEVQNLSKHFKDFSLQDVSFNVPTGTIVGFIGENGAGKTTTLKSILGLLHTNGGEIRVFGKDPVKDRRAIGEDIGIVMEGSFFSPTMTMREIGSVMSKLHPRWDAALFAQFCKRFELPEQKQMKDFSRGMRVKAAFATALAHHPKLMILDEATSGLDPVVRGEMLDLFLDFIQDEDHSILISSHITGDLEQVADSIAYLHQGKLLFQEDKDVLLSKYGILRCGAGDLAALPGECIVHTRRTDFGCETLVKGREEVLRLLPGAVCDPASIDDIMRFTSGRDKQ